METNILQKNIEGIHKYAIEEYGYCTEGLDNLVIEAQTALITHIEEEVEERLTILKEVVCKKVCADLLCAKTKVRTEELESLQTFLTSLKGNATQGECHHRGMCHGRCEFYKDKKQI